MRKITKESAKAFVNIEHFKKSNSEIGCSFTPNWDDCKECDEFLKYDAVSVFYLHGNQIAFMDETGRMPKNKNDHFRKGNKIFDSRKVKIDLCGWHTPTTRERINGVLDALGYFFKIAQRNHEQVLVRKRLVKNILEVQDILKLSDDSFDPDFAERVFNSKEFVSGTDLNAIKNF